ncbi:hypothetical protein BB558_004099 [Smittium angustum]|uniref:Uncharacterized protein n=1 Tax=Smittium angustum TaxID=133377 RepID=A0A2U1J493_SMIAN|nr:hypothetical protein BB558_004099 [Smittium angustum]
MEQSPALDVLGIGFLDGQVLLVNILEDQKLISFHQEGKVTSISFRTDLDNQAMMASANLDGDISIWNLEKKRIVCNMKNAHDGVIGKVTFIHGQPLLISSGEDNKIVEWLFDNYSGGDYGWPRVLKQRSGHYSSPQKIRFYGKDGKKILSAGRDQTLRMFSVIRDSQSVELSQRLSGKKAKRETRLPNIIQFAAEETREKDWDNIIACHSGQAFSTTWSMSHKAIGKHEYTPKDFSIVKATAISVCGNFGFVGTLSGNVEMFNMQSGQFRKTFKGHTKTITGIQTDESNKYIYTSSLDKTIKIFKQQDQSLVKSIDISSIPSSIVLHRSSGLIAAICDDMVIRVYDAEAGKLVRQFEGHKNQITDVAFSPDGRWLVSASLDSTIRTWDLPTGYLIDIFKVDSIPISLDFSPTFDFLVTSHSDKVGLCLWSNKAMFEHVEFRKISDVDIATVNVPASEFGPSDEDHVDIDGVDSQTDLVDEQEQINGLRFMLPEQMMEKSLLTLSNEPKNKWQTLLNLDLIKKRNKPVLPKKEPESAPFFLPTSQGVEPKFEKPKNLDSEKIDGDDDEMDVDSKVTFGFGQIETEMTQLLKKGGEINNYLEFFDYMSRQSVSSIDYEIRSLGGESDLLLLFKAIGWQLEEKKLFDATQAYLRVAINVHSDIIVDALTQEDQDADGLKSALKKILDLCETEWGQMDSLIRYTTCLVDHFTML